MLEVVANIFSSKKGAIKAYNAAGRELLDSKTVDERIVLEGLDDFEHPRHTWPHPVAIIGAGFYGVKMCMQYMIHKNENIMLFDRHAQASCCVLKRERDRETGEPWANPRSHNFVVHSCCATCFQSSQEPSASNRLSPTTEPSSHTLQFVWSWLILIHAQNPRKIVANSNGRL